jgi:hypothetical protein
MKPISELTREQALVLFPELQIPENDTNIAVLFLFDMNANENPEDGLIAVEDAIISYETKDLWNVDGIINDYENSLDNYLDYLEDEIPELEGWNWKQAGYYDKVISVLTEKYGTIEKAFETERKEMRVYRKAPYIRIYA